MMNQAVSATRVAKTPLGIAQLLGEVFRHYPAVLLRVAPFALVVSLINDLALEPALHALILSWQFGGVVMSSLGIVLANFVTTLFGSSFLLLISAVTVVMVAQRQEGERISLRQAVLRGLRYASPVFVLGFCINVLSGVATLVLVVPGIYLVSVYAVLTPVIVLEEAGFRALPRTLALTRGYRWSMVLVWLVPVLVAAGVSVLGGALVNEIWNGDYWDDPSVRSAFVTAVWAVLGTVIAPLEPIATAVLYFRLRDIKEGGGMAHLSRVFE